MTPMQSLKPQFDNFKKALPESFKELSLNKSEDSTHVNYFCGDRTIHNMKGVRSDFIKTFKAKFSDENSYSIGFSFKYLEVPQTEQTVQVSLKMGNKEPLYYSGEYLSIESFRIQFNQIIEKINTLEEKNYKSVAKIVQDDFNLLPNHHPKVKNNNQRKMKK